MFVILRPHSNTNSTGRYRVVDAESWQRYVNGAQDRGYTIAGEHKSYEQAEEQCDKLNAELIK